MSTEHTPGPWVSVVYPPGSCLDEDGQDLCAYIDSADTGQSVAHVFCEQDLSLRDANARLIAAAPDLLGALKQLRSWQGGKTRLRRDEKVLLQIANAAIAKATGEPS